MLITNIIFIDHEPNWGFPLHAHHELEISFVLEGEGMLSIRGKMYHLEKGKLAIKNAGVLHSEKALKHAPLSQICLSIDGVHKDGYEKNHLLKEDDVPVIDALEYYDLLKSIMLYLKDHEGEDSPLSDSLLESLYLLINDLIDKQESVQNGHELPPSKLMEEVTSYLDSHYQQPLSLDEIARHFSISKFYLEKKFKEQTHTTIGKYLTQRRIGEAERMLIYENIAIKEIAISCGFSNVQYFYTTFKKESGLTPLAFRNKYRKN